MSLLAMLIVAVFTPTEAGLKRTLSKIVGFIFAQFLIPFELYWFEDKLKLVRDFPKNKLSEM